jgi:hypothetical protein
VRITVTTSEKSSQLLITEALLAAASDVADSVAHIPRPSDSYAILGDLARVQEALTLAFERLADWHGQVVEGVHHAGDGGDDPDNPGWVDAERSLRRAADSSTAAADALRHAHSANGVARWFDEIRADEH